MVRYESLSGLQHRSGGEDVDGLGCDGRGAREGRQRPRRGRVELVRYIDVTEGVLRVDVVHRQPLDARHALSFGQREPDLGVVVTF